MLEEQRHECGHCSSPVGTLLTNLWKIAGDLIRDIPELLARFNFEYELEEIGGFGSVHMYVARKAP